MIQHLIFAMGIGRILLGLAPFLAMARSSRLLGVPVSHDNATGRLMARLFGVRDIGLGFLVFWALTQPVALPFVLLFNGLTDTGDLVAIAIPLFRRQGIDRLALTSAAFALPAGIAWFVVRALIP